MQDATKFHKTTLLTNEKQLLRAINDPLFHSLTSLGGGVYEISSKKKCVSINNLIQIAFFTYAKSKVIMLRFVYNFLFVYFDEHSFSIGHSDTDSLYLAFAKTETDNFEDLVIPQLRRQYFENRSEFLPSEVCQNTLCCQHYVNCRSNQTPWVQPPCCAKAELFDKRTPGLFKTEYDGLEVCFLNPKTYFCTGEKGDKMACKGVVKHLNPLKMDHFKRVLFDHGNRGNKHLVKNSAFRMVDGKMRTQVQYKYALSGVFIKRIVLDDKVHTIPLKL